LLGELNWAESPHLRAGRPYEPVWVIPVEGSGTSWASRNTDAGITAFFIDSGIHAHPLHSKSPAGEGARHAAPVPVTQPLPAAGRLQG